MPRKNATSGPYQIERIEKVAGRGRGKRSAQRPGAKLTATAILTEADFEAIAGELGTSPATATKVGYVSARVAETATPVETRWNGKETDNVAKPGDWIVTNLTLEKEILRDDDGNANTYVIEASRFDDLYQIDEGETEHGQVYRAIAEIESLAFPAGLDIVAPWGAQQTAASGYLVRNGSDIYAIAEEAFRETYRIG